jgi:hypothetical protein
MLDNLPVLHAKRIERKALVGFCGILWIGQHLPENVGNQISFRRD